LRRIAARQRDDHGRIRRFDTPVLPAPGRVRVETTAAKRALDVCDVMTSRSTKSGALLLFAFVIAAWGLNWTVTKLIVTQVTPLWTTAIRTGIGTLALLAMLGASKQFIIPKRADIPVILAISLFHMVAFSALMTTGLQYVPVGRSIVLGYTTPLWVAPGAWLLLNEALSARQVVGIAIGLTGLAIMFNPSAFDWTDRDAVLGNALLLLSALAWSVSILYTRAHHWIATPFQLVFWQALLATILLTFLALIIEGEPHIVWSNPLIMWFAYSGLVGTALGFWAMTVVGRSVPATTTSLGILATPVVGIASSAAFLGEQVDQVLLVAAAMIIVGIAIGTFNRSA
jgi:drug/metabolite transporter (DMT)-like permease